MSASEDGTQTRIETLLGSTGALLTALAILTPAIGFAARWISLAITGDIGPSLSVVALDSLVIHTATGAFLLFVGALFGGGSITGFLTASWFFGAELQRGGHVKRPPLWMVGILMVPAALFFPVGYILIPLMLIFHVGAYFVLRRFPPRSLGARHTWPVACAAGIFALSIAVITGAVPGIGVAQVSFVSSSPHENGAYIELSSNADFVALLPCADVLGAGAAIVPTDAIQARIYRSGSLRQAAASLWQILVDGRSPTLGLSTQCEDDV